MLSRASAVGLDAPERRPGLPSVTTVRSVRAASAQPPRPPHPAVQGKESFRLPYQELPKYASCGEPHRHLDLMQGRVWMPASAKRHGKGVVGLSEARSSSIALRNSKTADSCRRTRLTRAPGHSG